MHGAVVYLFALLLSLGDYLAFKAVDGCGVGLHGCRLSSGVPDADKILVSEAALVEHLPNSAAYRVSGGLTGERGKIGAAENRDLALKAVDREQRQRRRKKQAKPLFEPSF